VRLLGQDEREHRGRSRNENGRGREQLPHRRPTPLSHSLRVRALAKHAIDASEEEQLPLAVCACAHMREQPAVVAVVEQVR